MKLIAVIITYYPAINELVKNVYRYINYVDQVIIWENTPNPFRENYRINISEYDEKFVFLGTGKNEGIGYALNCSFEWAIKNDYDYILTMDQDSYWDNFDVYLDSIKNIQNDPRIAMFAPQIIDNFSKRVLRCNNNDFVITSGTIYKLSVFNIVGPFAESFFIDEVDNEYCIRSKKKGFHIQVINNGYLLQSFGQKDGNNYLSKYTANYSFERTFFQIRNRMWVWKYYSDELSSKYILRTILLCGIRRMICIIFYEKDKWRKLNAIFKGFYYGIFQKNDELSNT